MREMFAWAMLLIGVVVGQFSVDRAVTVPGYRLGLGSEGYAIQRTDNWSVVAEGWFPWHTEKAKQ